MFDNKLFAVLLGVVIALCSGHAIQTVFGWIGYILFPFFALFILVLISELRKLKLRIVDYAWLLILLMCVLSTAVNRGLDVSLYLQIASIATIGYFIATHLSFDVFIKWVQRVMTVIVIISLIGYFLVNNTSILDSLPIVSNLNDVEYGFGLVFNYITVVPDRNCGMFWEPGLFATAIAISTMFELVFKKEKVNWLRIILYFVTIITVNSSAGFVLMFFCMMLVVARTIKMQKAFSWWMPIVLGLLIAGIVAVLNLDMIISGMALADNPYFEKLLAENVENSSRIKAIAHNFEVFASDPIFGVGFSGAASVMEYVADTSTCTYLLSVFGIPGILYTVFWIVGIFKQKKNIFVKTLLCVIFMVILNKEPHHNLLISWIIMFYLLSGEGQDNGEKDELVDGGES